MQTSGVKTASASSLSGNVSTMAAGDSCTVNITDPRYGTSCSISSTKDCAGVCDGSAYFRCTSGSTSSYCSSGKYSVYLGKQQCSSGDATNSTSCYTCYNCTYSCPTGYSTSITSCDDGYKLDQKNIEKDQSSCPSSSTQCGKCVAKTCDDYSLYSSNQSDMHCSSVSKAPGLTCYSCHKPDYTCPSDSQSGSCSSGYYVSSTKFKTCSCGVSSSDTCSVCSECTYSCPSGYSIDTTSCSSGFTLKTTDATKIASSCPSKDCGKCERNFIPTPLPDPCSGSCSGDIPYYKVLQGNKCCCPTSSETNSIYCNCCMNTTKCPPNIPYPWVNSKGDNCCCADLDHVGGSGSGNWENPTSCICGL